MHCFLKLGRLGWENSSVLLITNVLQLEEVLAEANYSLKDLSYQHFTDIPTSGFTAGEKVQAVWSWLLWGKPSQFHKSLCQSNVNVLATLKFFEGKYNSHKYTRFLSELRYILQQANCVYSRASKIHILLLLLEFMSQIIQEFMFYF